jgi:DNA-binding GntR family transcriptional regulator
MSDHPAINEAVAQRLRDLINDKTIPPGARILEAEITRLMKVGRTPARHALRKLHAEGVLIAATGQGYQVATPDTPAPPTAEVFSLKDVAEKLAARPSLIDSYQAIERQIAHLSALGSWRISATALSKAFQLKRGKVEEVLNRMQAVGLVAPRGQTRWAVVELSASRMDQVFSVRRWIEPNLLAEAVVNIPLDVLNEAIDTHQKTLTRYPDVTGIDLDALERILHTELPKYSHNDVGLAALESARSTLIFNKQALATSAVPLSKEEPFIVEHLSILDAIRRRNSEECRLRLQAHLMKSRAKVEARLVQFRKSLKFDIPAYATRIPTE